MWARVVHATLTARSRAPLHTEKNLRVNPQNSQELARPFFGYKQAQRRSDILCRLANLSAVRPFGCVF